MTLQRLRHAIEVLGGVSKKKMKELEKRNASFGGFLNQA
jgi:glutamyl-tRNA synthetase